MLQLTSENFDNEIKNGRVLVDYYATWCGPCQMLSPILSELADEYKDIAKICKVDVDNDKELAKRYKVLSIPTVIIFNDGEEINRMVGVKNKEDYIAALK